MKRENILGIFGDGNFPKIGSGYSQIKRGVAIQRTMDCLSDLKAELVYIIPTAGTCVEFLAMLNILKIPYILVIPYKDFVNVPHPAYKALLKQAAIDAKNVIILDLDTSLRADKSIKFEEAIKFVRDNSNKVLKVYSYEEEDSPYMKLVDSICSNLNEPDILDFVYDEELPNRGR